MRFAGYAALFHKQDAGKDIIIAGAFARTLADRNTEIPLLWQHMPERQIGWIQHAEEDNRGLRIVAKVSNPNGKAAHNLTQRHVSGLSFGYRARRYQTSESGRILVDIDLFEVSLVTHPLQNAARVHLIT